MPIKLYPPPGISFDANNNIVVNNTLEGFTTTATAAATTTLTVASTPGQEFTGSTTQIVKLPVASTLTVGQEFYIVNNSSGVVTVNSSGNNLVQTMAANTAAIIKNVLITGTTAASWDSAYIGGSSGVTNSAGNNIVTKSNGTNLVASSITDDGTTVTTALPVVAKTGFSTSAPSYQFSGQANTGITHSGNDVYIVSGGETFKVSNNSDEIGIKNDWKLGFAAADPSGGAVDAYFTRVVTGVMLANNWLQTRGTSRVAADVTNATATMANITGLSATLIAGRFYTGRMILFAQDATAVDGFKCDFDGGTATMTGFRAHGTIYDTALLLSTPTSAIATDFVAPTMTGVSKIEIDFGFTCNGAGTFIPRFAKNAVTALDATVFRESWMSITDTA